MERRVRLGLGLLVAALSGGCGKLPIDVSTNLSEQTVQGSPIPAGLPSFLPTAPLVINLQAESEKHNVGPAQSATLKSFTLSTTPHGSPSGNFDFLDRIQVEVSASSDNSLSAAKIAELSPVPDGKTTISLTPVSGIDLLPYLKQNAVVSAQAVGRTPTSDITYDGEVTITLYY
jgi:hypothetical protein